MTRFIDDYLESDYDYVEINPCKGCEDFDGKTCTSNGACGDVRIMTDYVSKEELEEFFEGITITVGGRTRAEAVRDVLKAVYNGVMKLPTTDAVPVIRCKDCKFLCFTGTVWKCQNRLVMMLCEPNDYCSRAEKNE